MTLLLLLYEALMKKEPLSLLFVVRELQITERTRLSLEKQKKKQRNYSCSDNFLR